MKPLVHSSLPRFRDLFSAIFLSLPDAQITYSWHCKGEFAFLFSRSAWSLTILAKCFLRVSNNQFATLWLPDYYCNSSLAPLRELGVKFVFYPITHALAPDYDACQRLALDNPVDLFVLTHFFGDPAPVQSFVSFCAIHHAWLIEDAVHVLKPISGVGQFGDFVLYSPHKHLPIPDGSVLVVRPNGPSQFARSAYAMSSLRQVIDQSLVSSGYSLSSWLWLIKRIAQRLGVRRCSYQSDFKADFKQTGLPIYSPRMSILAKRLISPICLSLEAVASQREKNAISWSNFLAFFDAESCLTFRHSSNTPYLAAFSADSISSTESFFTLLNQSNIPATTWPDLPPEVTTPSGLNSIAFKLRQTFFYLPIHQSLTHTEILFSGKTLASRLTSNWSIISVPYNVWQTYWNSCSHTNLFQSWEYGSAKQEAEGWIPRRLVICDGENQPIGLVQVLTKGLPLLGHIARINRGPILMNTVPVSSRNLFNFLCINLLIRYSSLFNWRILKIAPEILQHSFYVNELILLLGFQKSSSEAWSSGRISLCQSENDLLNSFHGKWRNLLRKGLKSPFFVSREVCGLDQLTILLNSYSSLQKLKNFKGISEKLICSLFKLFGETDNFGLFIAKRTHIALLDQADSLGVLVAIRSGDTATYLIGSSSDEGKKLQANSVLLWEAIMWAKSIGCLWFDIGGLSRSTPSGIASFKKGLNSDLYELVGEFTHYNHLF